MTRMRYLILFLLLSTLAVALIRTASGVPASSFSQQDGDWYDNWGIDRNNAGTNGELPAYLPNLASETLGKNKELAYSIGEWFQNNYPSKTDRAVAILKYVQTWTEYGYDSARASTDLDVLGMIVAIIFSVILALLKLKRTH